MKGIILSGGRADQSLCQVFGDIPTALIPIYGKPIIFHILNEFLKIGITEVYITIGHQAHRVESYVNNFFQSSKMKVHFILVDETKKPGNSLFEAIKKIKSGKVFISLADTICEFDKTYIDKGDYILASRKFDKSDLWCTVLRDKNNKLISIRDKEKDINKKELALTGIYVLNDISVFNELTSINSEEDNYEISYLLKKYNEHNEIKVLETSKWLDFGHIEKYQKSKKRLLEARSFNSLTFNDTLGTITKKSTYTEKFVAEIQWLINLPNQLKVLSPRVLEYSLNQENSFVTMEYYSYQTMTEIWLFSNFNKRVLKSIIDKVLEILYLFTQEKRTVSKEDYNSVYLDKTLKRVALIQKQQHKNLEQLLSGNEEGYVSINNRKLKSWSLLQEKVISEIKNLYNENDNCLIHGDYCFSNLLYDINSGVLRLIDPRGIWGTSSAGDIKYDIAKLRHSIVGDYDFIVNDLFLLTVNNTGITYKIENTKSQLKAKKYFDNLISKEFNLKDIKLIEGLLFLSMIPLHANSSDRQVVLLAKAIEKLNDFSN